MTWHHGFVIIVTMKNCQIWVNILLLLLLLYLNDLKFKIQKYHLLLQLISINNNSISNDNDVACHVSTRCYN
jgi:hypothetical protein